ncbi:MAG: metal ABC transporter permease [Spirochaetia bacterium]
MIRFVQALLNPEVTFIRYAFIAGIISSIPFGIIGSFVVVRRMSYIAGAVSHSVLGGIGLALYLSGVAGVTFLTPMIGAFFFAVLSGLIISAAVIRRRERLDTVIGAIWAVGMSVGLLFISKTPGYGDPMSYIFGNILLIGRSDIILILILNVIIISLSIIFFNQFLAVSFDEEFAQVRGLKISFFQILLILLVSLTVLLMITIVGIVMVIALLTIPPAIAGLFSRSLKRMILKSILLCAAFTSAGLIVSYILRLPTSSVTVALAGAVYLGAIGIKRLRIGNRVPRKTAGTEKADTGVE